MFVETGDLLHCCPIAESHFQPPPEGVPLWSKYFRRMRAVREAWSYKIVEIAAPFPAEEITRGGQPEGDMSLHDVWMFYYLCQTRFYWKVIGPKALLADLGGENLYLCQHEIEGD
jgi:hypothetical protein